MASIETTAFILGILAGVAFGLFWAYRILKKRRRNIPKDILEDFEKISKIKKEVQENGKENYKEESSKELKRGGREPRGFTDEQGRSLQYGDGERTPIIESRERNRFNPIEWRRRGREGWGREGWGRTRRMNPLTPKDKRVVITNLIVVTLLGIVLLVLLNLAITVKEESFQCINDPLGYGAIKLKERNKAEFSCTCSLAKPNSPILFFDSESKSIIYPKVQQSTEDFHFNFSEIIIP